MTPPLSQQGALLVEAHLRAQYPNLDEADIRVCMRDSAWAYVDGEYTVDLRVPPVARLVTIKVPNV